LTQNFLFTRSGSEHQNYPKQVVAAWYVAETGKLAQFIYKYNSRLGFCGREVKRQIHLQMRAKLL
jgi:hypothetical protein